jgi:hypothetical protein
VFFWMMRWMGQPVVRLVAGNARVSLSVSRRFNLKTMSSTPTDHDSIKDKAKQYAHDNKAKITGFATGTGASVAVGAAATVLTGGNLIVGAVAAGMVGNVVSKETEIGMLRKEHGEEMVRPMPKSTQELKDRVHDHAKRDAIPAVSGAIGGGVAGVAGGHVASAVMNAAAVEANSLAGFATEKAAMNALNAGANKVADDALEKTAETVGQQEMLVTTVAAAGVAQVAGEVAEVPRAEGEESMLEKIVDKVKHVLHLDNDTETYKK